LKEQKGSSEAIERKNKIRRMVQHFFTDRDCNTIVRPVEEEKNLQRLNSLPNSELREEFLAGMDNLRSSIFKKVKKKMLRGKSLNGNMLIQLATKYTEALNQG
jgi:hypothetical protein